MKDTVLDRIRKLINLAASSNQKEAERAAYKACALIREHKLDVCDPEVIDGIYKEQAKLEDQVRRLEAGDLETAFGNAAQSLHNLGGGISSFLHTHTSTPFIRQPPVQTPPVAPPMAAPAPLAAANWDAICLQCNGVIKKGDPALWQKGKGMWHSTTDCYQRWMANQRATASFNPFTHTSSS